MKNKYKKEGGYTLAELVVAMSIFILASTLISGLFVRSIQTQRQSNHLTTINSDASFIIERMNREVREGYTFTSPDANQSCADGSSNRLEFIRNINGNETTVSYTLDNENNDITRQEGEGSTPQPINSAQTSINDLCFILTQPTSEDPWRITVTMEIGSDDPNVNYTSNVQTTISSRSLPEDVNGNDEN